MLIKSSQQELCLIPNEVFLQFHRFQRGLFHQGAKQAPFRVWFKKKNNRSKTKQALNVKKGGMRNWRKYI